MNSRRAMPNRRMDDPNCRNPLDADLTIRSAGRGTTRQLAWEIASINAYLEEIHQIWASALGLSYPQFRLLMALSMGDAVAVNVIAKMLHVEASFVTSQSKALEKRGLLHRRRCLTDRRVVQLSLSDKAYQQLGDFVEQQVALDEFIFKEFAVSEKSSFISMLAVLKRRIEKVRHRAALDCLPTATHRDGDITAFGDTSSESP
ncbi:DNA-binding MarR family transcriptional regulator [Bradyrhizobium sp. GM2.2]|uniref:MarR family winged helix-turn-helix transcriptional regulator n=1 Tax=Bradyrhizobium sp. GM2.2 TaxID=3156358 RepID=UPI003398BC84